MNIIFRADSSSIIGSGHIMRCLALAEKLKKDNNIIFISRKLPSNVNGFIKEYGFILFELPFTNPSADTWLQVSQEEDAAEVLDCIKKIGKVDRLFVDHYAIDINWEKLIKPHVERLLVIDDLGNRDHFCDFLLDTSTENAIKKYQSKVNVDCKFIFGRRFQLFRDEFLEEHKRTRSRDGVVKKVLLSFGGSDPTGELLKLVPIISSTKYQNIEFKIIAGGGNLAYDKLKKLCDGKNNLKLYHQVNNMAELLNNTDVCIGAAGGSVWERVFLGVPSFSVSVAENQDLEERPWSLDKPYIYLGSYRNFSPFEYGRLLDWIIKNPLELVKLSKRAIKFFKNYDQQLEELKKVLI